MICLNKNCLLTHGSPIGFSAIPSRLKPGNESYTAVVETTDSGAALIGQVTHRTDDRAARLNYVVYKDTVESKAIAELWDELCSKAGEMGAVNVLAQVEEDEEVFESLRRAGFIAYGWESAWKLPKKVKNNSESCWTIAGDTDVPPVRALYQALVPPIVQTAEAFANGDTRRLVYRENGEIVAYVESNGGPEGLYLKPLIHPSIKDVSLLLNDLIGQFNDLGQPVYLQVRSYQAWLLDALEAIGGEDGSHFTLLVKYLAIMQRNGVTITNRKLVENRHAEPTTPIVNNMTAGDPHAQP